MKSTIKSIAPWLVAAAIGGAIGLAPVASAATVPNPTPAPPVLETGPDPLVPYGTNPYIPFELGHDGPYTTAGRVDLAF
jgi:hypothetical protein